MIQGYRPFKKKKNAVISFGVCVYCSGMWTKSDFYLGFMNTFVMVHELIAISKRNFSACDIMREILVSNYLRLVLLHFPLWSFSVLITVFTSGEKKGDRGRAILFACS